MISAQSVMFLTYSADLFCGDLSSLIAGQRQYFVTAGFHGPGLMDIDMSRHGTEHPLMRAKRRIYDRQIRLGASYQKMNRQCLVFTGFTDLIRRPGAVNIFPVTRRLF